MVIELGQGSVVRPRVGIVVVHGKGMQVAHVLDLFGQRSRELVFGELCMKGVEGGEGVGSDIVR